MKISKKDFFHNSLRAGFVPQFADDAAFATGKGSSAAAGDEYYNTTYKEKKIHNGSFFKFVDSEYIDAVSAAGFTRASTSTITVTDNATNQDVFKTGKPVRYRSSAGSGSFLYGVIESYSSGTVTICGIELPSTIGDFQVGSNDKIDSFSIIIPGNLSTGDDKISSVLKTDLIWLMPKAYIVKILCFVKTAASGANLHVALGVGAAGNDIINSPGYVNLAQATSVVNSGILINSSNYDIDYLEKIYINIDQVGSTEPGRDLTVFFTYIKE